MKPPPSLHIFVLLALVICTGVLRAGAPGETVVGIEATVSETTEPAPNIRVIPGQFTVHRRGDTTNEITVWLQYTGTATAGSDYRELPSLVTFAPGEDSVKIAVHAIDDEEVEVDEQVIASLHDPTGAIPRFAIDPNRARAVVTIKDSDKPSGERPVVSIKATRPIAEETAAPLRRINLVGELTVSRTGPTEHAQPVWLGVAGTASENDYERIPVSVRIPEGQSSVTVPVRALFDQDHEGIESVIVRVDRCPPPPLLGGVCYDFAIDPDCASATVFIREDGLSEASLLLRRPENGAEFHQGEPIELEAIAVHLEGFIGSVEFFAGDTRIGESVINFVRAPDPGTPIVHRLVWENAPAGEHLLTARATVRGDRETVPVLSNPVRIVVGGDPPKNLPPRIEIAAPPSGSVFPAGQVIEIVGVGRDEDGFIAMVEYFANGLKIGEKKLVTFVINPPVGAEQRFAFQWQNAIPGNYELTIRATDSEGAASDSAPIPIVVSPRDQRPGVNVVARDALAVEPGPERTANPATFRIRRHGSTAGDLVVNYSLDGSAENGTDYQLLSGLAVIPDGLSSIDVTVVPLADQEREESETVVLKLEDGSYNLEFPGRASAVIRDRPMPDPDRPRCLRLADGHIHLCFPGRPGVCIRVEASSNLRDWTTLFCVIAVDGTVHIVQDTTPGVPNRFFRISEEPNESPDG